MRQLAPEIVAPVPPLVNLSTATTSFPPESSAAQNIALAAKRFDGLVVQPNETVSFLAVVGEMTRTAGYVEGDAIAGGRLVREIGGGVCQVSSTLYRAVFSAGLEIVERHPHSHQLAFFADMPGFEAAFYAPGIDPRWRNDTPYDIFIAAEASESVGTLTISLWGRSDGRTITMSGPVISDRRDPGAAQWWYDSSVPDGAVRQIVRARSGMQATIGRVVQSTDGHILHEDIVTTCYAPWTDVKLFGASVAPPAGAMIVERPPKRFPLLSSPRRMY